MRSSRDPRLLELITWAVVRGAKTFRQVTVTDDARLVATAHIPHYDFACAVPASMTTSLLDIAARPDVPRGLRVAPENYAAEVKWFPGANWGMVAFAAHCTMLGLDGRSEPGMAAHLSLLAEHCATDDAPLAVLARRAAKTAAFQTVTEPLVARLNTERSVFDEAFALMYCALRRVGTPLWSGATRQGAATFGRSPYGRSDVPAGDVVGAIPLLSLARHSSNPSCVIGVPDSQMTAWLAAERRTRPDVEYYVLQTTRAVFPGQELTVDRNAQYGLPPSEFEAWFGRPWNDEEHARQHLEAEDASGAAVKGAGQGPASEDGAGDIFF
jgi:hypothetical protein